MNFGGTDGIQEHIKKCFLILVLLFLHLLHLISMRFSVLSALVLATVSMVTATPVENSLELSSSHLLARDVDTVGRLHCPFSPADF
jgi:hypothetical protein